MKLKNTLVISAFPACGKTYATEKLREEGYKVLDSDSSRFSWTYEAYEGCPFYVKERNSEFPANYIKHIKENIGKADIIFISSHKEVRNALYKEEIQFTICIPYKESGLSEWVGRCYLRGNEKSFIDMLIKNWNSWLDEIRSEEKHFNVTIAELENFEYCYDLVKNLI